MKQEELLEQLVNAIEWEMKVVALAIPFLSNQRYFSSRSLVLDIGDCFDTGKDSKDRWYVSTKSTLEACMQLESQGIFNVDMNVANLPRTIQWNKDTKVFTYGEDHEVFTSAALLAIKYMAKSKRAVSSFLGRFHDHNERDLYQWFQALSALGRARHDTDSNREFSHYLTIKDLSDISPDSIHTRLKILQLGGYILMENQNSEVGRFSKNAADVLADSDREIDQDILRYMQDHRLVETGNKFYRNDINDYLLSKGYNKSPIKDRLNRLKKAGIYRTIQEKGHCEVKITEAGKELLVEFLRPLKRLTTKKRKNQERSIYGFFKAGAKSYLFRQHIEDTVQLYAQYEKRTGIHQ